jgi:hypothetical protein
MPAPVRGSRKGGEAMKEFADTLIYHIENAAKRDAKFDAECRAELEVVLAAAEDRIARIERRIKLLEEGGQE